ncbi:helix-turn-helix domain-containing protein [Nonomuraea sp. NPDC052129]|uniref:PucR family transcriptional regulator n=1 Tax=Nonomuraea sp. NPDC052129 TaxID=3154651 RepID=UPI00343D3225
MSGGFSTETLTGSAMVRVQRTRILSELLDHLADLADTAVQTMRAEIPAYAAQDENFLADVRDQVVRHYRSKLAVMLEDRTATVDDIAFARRAAMRRARAGLALADYINAFRIGQRVFWGSVLERAGHSAAGHEAALSLAAPIMRYCDFASTHAANAYMEFQHYAAAEVIHESRDLLETLLAGGAPTRGGQLAAAQAYGLGSETRTPLLVVIAVLLGPRALVAGGDPVTTGPDRGVDARHAACAAISRAGANGTRTLSVVRQSEIVAIPALGPGGDPEELCERLQAVRESLMGEGILLAMGISTVVAGTAGIPQAYDEARTVLEFLPEDGGVAALPRLSPFQYLALRADDTARHLVDPRITALLSEDRARGGVLTATIRAFAAADLNLRASAERLQIHPNTAQYRLRRIQERTGRSLRRINDLLDLLVAIALHDSLPPTPEQPPNTNQGGQRLATVTDERRGSGDVRSFHESR